MFISPSCLCRGSGQDLYGRVCMLCEAREPPAPAVRLLARAAEIAGDLRAKPRAELVTEFGRMLGVTPDAPAQEGAPRDDRVQTGGVDQPVLPPAPDRPPDA